MDLNQVKLSKTEWTSTEIPISQQEMKIVRMIVDGYDDFNIRENENQSIASFIKMTSVQGVHEYLYIHYFENDIKKLGTSSRTKGK